MGPCVTRIRGDAVSGVPLRQWVERSSSGELVRAVASAESAILSGAAIIEDYELFVLGRQELARRSGEVPVRATQRSARWFLVEAARTNLLAKLEGYPRAFLGLLAKVSRALPVTV